MTRHTYGPKEPLHGKDAYQLSSAERPSSSNSESEERRLLRRIGQWDMLEHPADGRYWTHEIDALLARQSTGWVAIQDNCERVLHLSRAHGWRVDEVLTEPNAAPRDGAGPESAAPQPSTADRSTAPSQEGVGPGEVAVAADSPDTPSTDAVHYGCALYERDVERYRDMAEHARSLERHRNEALGRERLANMRADQAEEARDAAREIANEATLLLEGQGAQSATGECKWSEDGDGVWNTDCGQAWVFDDGGTLKDHSVNFCYHCGRRAADKTASDKGQGLPDYPLALVPGCKWPECDCKGRWECSAATESRKS